MDYLRQNALNKTPFYILLQIVEEMIPHFREKKVFQSKLYHMQASFLWKMGSPKEAVQMWLIAIENDPSCLKENLWVRNFDTDPLFKKEIL